MARNILASPRAPSCVLNHFPVDSAVCNPIIGVSPPGKLLFYSRTTRAPDVLRVPRYSLSFSFFLRRFFSPVSLRSFRSSSPRSRLQRLLFSFFSFPPTTFPPATPNSARRFVYFALLDPYRRESCPSGFRKPRLRTWKLNDREGNENCCTRVREVDVRARGEARTSRY